jgi:glycine betaine/proline transport system permease protein
MTAATTNPEAGSSPMTWRLAWFAAVALSVGLYLLADRLPWASAYPKEWQVPFIGWTGGASQWIIGVFFDFTRAISAVLRAPIEFSISALGRGFTIDNGETAISLPPLSWVGIIAAVTIVCHAYGGTRLALLGGLCFLFIAVTGQWESAMRTLALIVNCVPLGIVGGLFLGIVGYKWPRLNRAVIVPAMDLGQAVPAFAYLVPMLMLYGNNPVSAMLATLIYATPPMVRNTTLALSLVEDEIKDFGHMVGCTRRQHLWRIMVPSARQQLMVGVNQVINAALNMVIVASMIGAGGLGYDVLLALRSLKVGTAIEAGMAMVALAIVLDRLSQAMAAHNPAMLVPGRAFWARHPHFLAAGAVLAATSLLSPLLPALSMVPETMTVTAAPLLDSFVRAVVIVSYDVIDAIKVFFQVYALKPFRNFLLTLPWPIVLGLVSLAGLRLGGLRLALLVAGLTLFCMVTGLWEKSVWTIYLVGISTIVSCLIGVPLGVWSARNETANRVLTVVVDMLQTFPLFVYLIPAVMLLGVGDVAAMLGIVLYALTPAIRYTNEGIRQVPAALVEAATAAGCTRGQILWRVQFPLALPVIMLGINQVVMFALAMDIIAAMIGTRDLGQEIFKALSKADPGLGIVAGLAVAAIGMVVDRLLRAWSENVRRRYGLA